MNSLKPKRNSKNGPAPFGGERLAEISPKKSLKTIFWRNAEKSWKTSVPKVTLHYGQYDNVEKTIKFEK
jgi:hypothetical protein